MNKLILNKSSDQKKCQHQKVLAVQFKHLQIKGKKDFQPLIDMPDFLKLYIFSVEDVYDPPFHFLIISWRIHSPRKLSK